MKDLIKNWDKIKAKMQRMKREENLKKQTLDPEMSSYTKFHEKYYWKNRDQILEKAREKYDLKRKNKYAKRRDQHS